MANTPNLIEREEHIRCYKTVLKDVLDRRPSGIRLKIAKSIARNKSFVSQITNPNYKTPVPERHLDLIFEAAYFTQEEKDHFLKFYWRAHPRARGRVPLPAGSDRTRTLRIVMPSLASAADEARVDQLVRDFALRINDLAKAHR